MADRYRKSVKKHATINCKITGEAKAYLIELSGEFAIGYAIERLVEEHRKKQHDRAGFIVGPKITPTLGIVNAIPPKV